MWMVILLSFTLMLLFSLRNLKAQSKHCVLLHPHGRELFKLLFLNRETDTFMTCPYLGSELVAVVRTWEPWLGPGNSAIPFERKMIVSLGLYVYRKIIKIIIVWCIPRRAVLSHSFFFSLSVLSKIKIAYYRSERAYWNVISCQMEYF